MAFAIFYDDSDLPFLEEAAQNGALVISNPDRQQLQKYWNGGLENWRTAPLGQSPFEEPMANSNIRQIVISGQNLTLLDFRNLLYRIAADNPSISYLKALADDMGRNCGGIENWNG